ncbi:MAG: DUF1667 domain-containing protein [Turicibacter sp.]
MADQHLTCIVCPIGCSLTVDADFNVSGNKCKRGIVFAKKELTHPTRMVTTTVKIKDAIHQRLPVVTTSDVPKALVKEVVTEVQKIEVVAPVAEGQVILANVLETGVDFIAARTMAVVSK